MKLSTDDAELFFKLMWRLQCYVNQKHQTLPDVNSVDDYVAVMQTERAQVRNALWENPS